MNIYDAKTRLSALIAQGEQPGEEIVIRRHNVPVAKLVPFRPVLAPRRLGGWGDIEMADDFDQLPSEVAAAFAGERP